MAKATTVNPEEVIQNSTSNHFQILFQTEPEILSWTTSGFHNVDIPSGGFLNIQMFRREEVIKEYYNASRDIKTLPVGDGILHLVELPF